MKDIYELSEQIENYYKDNFDKLADGKQFHFASRLASWKNDLFSVDYLNTIRKSMIGDGSAVSIADKVSDIINKHELETNINAASERQPFFDRWPDLRIYNQALFYIRHLESIYGIDCHEAIAKVAPKGHLDLLAEEMARDEAAIRILSTYAINYIFLVKHILYTDPEFIDDFVNRVYKSSSNSIMSNPIDYQLFIYLYTHLIIGEANFYSWKIKDSRKEIYNKMINDMDDLIKDKFDYINLDNKVEFLVCARMLGAKVKSQDEIYAECLRSLSNDGSFIVDTNNKFGQSNKTSFNDSEHRNVLLIMSLSEYPLA